MAKITQYKSNIVVNYVYSVHFSLDFLSKYPKQKDKINQTAKVIISHPRN